MYEKPKMFPGFLVAKTGDDLWPEWLTVQRSLLIDSDIRMPRAVWPLLSGELAGLTAIAVE